MISLVNHDSSQVAVRSLYFSQNVALNGEIHGNTLFLFILMEVPSCENHVSMASWTPERKNRIKDRTPHIFIYFLYKIGDLSSFWRCGIWHGYLIIKKGISSMDNGFGMIWV